MSDAADEQPEVQSPLKKTPAPDADAVADADNEPADASEPSLAAALAAAADVPASDKDKPSSTAAASGEAPSSKALAAGKRKGLTVAKAAAGEPQAALSPHQASGCSAAHEQAALVCLPCNPVRQSAGMHVADLHQVAHCLHAHA